MPDAQGRHIGRLPRQRRALRRGRPPAYAPFIDIWRSDGRATACPNDVLVAADGSLLISDDQGGQIYR